MAESDATHVAKADLALDDTMGIPAVVQSWVDEGRPGSADGLRARLEAAAGAHQVSA